jgi:pimeloyl-ACP methyl ester carboxylesterase
MARVTTLLLLHGGLWAEGMNADRFWRVPGIVTGLEDAGFEVVAPDRPARAPSWQAEVDAITPYLPAGPVTVVAGSNGCSAAALLASTAPDRVERLLLAWPATAGDPTMDRLTRRGLTDRGAPPRSVDALLSGGTLRGLSDAEIARFSMPVGVLPSLPANPVHQRRTVDALCDLLPHAIELPGCPEPPRRDFAPYLEIFLEAVTTFAAG